MTKKDLMGMADFGNFDDLDDESVTTTVPAKKSKETRRTSFDMDRDLWEALRIQAVKEGTSLRALLNEGARMVLREKSL